MSPSLFGSLSSVDLTHRWNKSIKHLIRFLSSILFVGVGLSVGLFQDTITSTVHAQGTLCEQPNILLILDHSGSMNDDNKWNQAIEAINQVTFGFDLVLRFGLMYFPSQGNCGIDINRGLLNEVLPSNGANIRRSLTNLPGPDGGTPLADSINVGVQYFNQLNDQNRKNILVLITDGEESCDRNPTNSAQQANQSGYPVYVIGFGRGVNGNSLRNMAQAGGTQDYFQANNANDLFEALRSISNQASAEGCDGADNDCDGVIDEDIPPQVCETQCGLGEKLCVDGQLLDCAGGQIPQESCDGLDNDCDGIADEIERVPCTTSSNNPGSAECLEGGVISEDCDPDDPDREEICDGIDNDLDGNIDENTDRTCNYECHYGRELCIEGQLRSCSAAPTGPERCNGADDDCDGLIDEGSECPGREICGDEGQCLVLCDSGECFPGFNCEPDNYCHPFPCNPECPEGQRCINQVCITPCIVDEQCEAINETCDSEEQRCVPSMSTPNSGEVVGGAQTNGMNNSMNPNGQGGTQENGQTPNEPSGDIFITPESNNVPAQMEPPADSEGAACSVTPQRGLSVSLALFILLCALFGVRLIALHKHS